MKKKRLLGIGLAILLLFGFIFKDSLSQTSPESLKGGFKEVAFTRNEQNTGPVIRLYIVSVEKIEGAQFQAYGDLMPHTKYGITKVFFFKKNAPIPTNISETEPHFDSAKFTPIAKYQKNPMSNSSLSTL